MSVGTNLYFLLHIVRSSMIGFLNREDRVIANYDSILVYCMMGFAFVWVFVIEDWSGLFRTAYARVEVREIDDFPKNSKNLIVIVDQTGSIIAVTNEYFHKMYSVPAKVSEDRPRTLQQKIETNRERDIIPSTASGSIVKFDGNLYLLTNFHVMLNARKELERKSIHDQQSDLAILPISNVALSPDILLENRYFELSDISNNQIAGEVVQYAGLAKGHHFLSVIGEAFLFQTEQMYLNNLCLRVPRIEDPVYNRGPYGNSGSAVENMQGELVGVISSNLSLSIQSTFFNCYLFTGIDQVRQIFNRISITPS